MIKTLVLTLAVSSLASCGGDSGPDGYQMALDQANAAQAQAVSLAAASPCSAVQQCGVLRLTEPAGHCAVASYRPYSLVSATADAASAAAANERDLAERAVSLSPPTACSQAVQVPPSAVCVANTCQAAQPQ
jgi:hypothetical protein